MSDHIEHACIVMHDAYEDAAARNGWDTQEASRKPWGDVPEANKATMRDAVRALADAGLLRGEGYGPRWLAEHDRAVAAKALRDAARYDHEDHMTDIALGGIDYVQDWLNARADRIEAGEADE